jgi:hypothetical protein
MSFFRHGEIFRSDVRRSIRRHELPSQIARPDSSAKNSTLRTRYKRSASMPDTLGYSRKTPQLPAIGFFYTRERPIRRPLAHRLDEFPVGYSSASCTPAELASALPTGIHSATRTCRRQPSFQLTANSVLTFCVTSGDNPSSPIQVSHGGRHASRKYSLLSRLSFSQVSCCWYVMFILSVCCGINRPACKAYRQPPCWVGGEVSFGLAGRNSSPTNAAG